MKKLIAFILVLAITVCLVGCNETATSEGELTQKMDGVSYSLQ